MLDSPISTIRDRVQRMEQAKIIKGYTVAVDHAKLGFPMKIIVDFTRDRQISLEEFIAKINEILEIISIQFLTGETDELLTLFVNSIDHLREVLYSRLPKIPGIIRTTSAIVLFEFNPLHIHPILTTEKLSLTQNDRL
jgi:DNA-binding Lrp family transcriptional regulator